jgi:hypothetical protein
VTIAEQIAFATQYLHADYIFWCTEEPYYSNQVVPFLRGDKKTTSAVKGRVVTRRARRLTTG